VSPPAPVAVRPTDVVSVLTLNLWHDSGPYPARLALVRAWIEQLDPDVIIMDLSMPDLSGIDAMKRIHERRPDLPVVILTAHADDGTEREAREAGASGFVAKGTGLRDLVIVLHEAAELDAS